jgi:two-component system sensor histidine kinase KdpD
MTKQELELEAERERIHRQMLSSVSHDLKTPLAAIIGSLEIFGRMREVLTPEKAQILLDTALKEAYRLDGFITNILDMAKLENAMVRLHLDICHLSTLLHDCVEKSGQRLQGSHITIAPIDQKLECKTDAALLCRAISLLIDNAIKFSPEQDSEVRLSAYAQGPRLVIEVSDNGPGIPEDKMEEIFSKYTRIKRQDHQNAGTGLGLPIARSIAQLLGGNVLAANRPDGGALFTLYIPLAT